jgi:hypothetical protein
VTSDIPPTVRTLRAAHEYLHRQWPGQHASQEVWLAYHRRAAALYELVAKTDLGHQHEAVYWAQREHESAGALAEEIACPAAPCSATSIDPG